MAASNFKIKRLVGSKETIVSTDQIDVKFGGLSIGANAVATESYVSSNYVPTSQKGAASGVCPLNASTKIDATYLPSYVDDVLEYANLAAFPAEGASGLIYVALDTNKCYRWSGSAYVEISPSEVTSVNGETGAVTLDAGDIDIVDSGSNFTSTEVEGALAEAMDAAQAAQEDVDDLVTLSGVAVNAEHLGTFTGATIADSSTIKAALQALETKAEGTVSDLASTANAKGASLVGIEDSAAQFTSTNVEGALAEALDAAQAAQGSANDAQADVDDLVTLSGVAVNAEHLGEFTGSTIADNSTIKAALQSLETKAETIVSDLASVANAKGASLIGIEDSAAQFTATTVEGALAEALDAAQAVANDVGNLVTLSGVAVDSTHLGEFTGTTIADSSTIKSALQALETAVEAVSSGSTEAAQDAVGAMIADTESINLTYTDGTPELKADVLFTISFTAGEGLSAGDVVYVKAADGKVWKAANTAAATCEAKLGIAMATVDAEAAVLVTVKQGAPMTGSSLTPGAKLFLGAAGALSQTEPDLVTGIGTWIVPMGEAISATRWIFNPEFAVKIES